MISDNLLRQLFHSDKEPITPFLYKIQSLYQKHRVSMILVMGGAMEYFSVANTVLLMDSYVCNDATDGAKEIYANSQQQNTTNLPFGDILQRLLPDTCVLIPKNGKVKARSKNKITYGDIALDITGLEQVFTKAQTTTISQALQTIDSAGSRTQQTATLFWDVLSRFEKHIESQPGLFGLTALGQFHGGMAQV